MPALRSLRAIVRFSRRRMYYWTAGGEWTVQLPVRIQRNLRWFFFDGVLSSASDSVVLTYLTLYVLALGASPAQIGLMDALASLSAMLLLIPGAMLADRARKRKPIILLWGGGISRLSLLLLALLPLAIKHPVVIYAAIALRLVQVGFGNLALPAWTSLTADVVPLAWRGRYFGSRNVSMGIASMIMVFLVGQMITRAGGSVTGYQLALGLSFLIGMLATFSYAQIYEPAARKPASASPRYSPAALLQTFKADRNFLTYSLYAMLWNFSLMVAGPFFSVYLVRDLKATAFLVGINAIVSSLAALPAQRLFGRLDDRWGSHRIMQLTGFLIPTLPFSWWFVTAPWQVIPINIVGGILWAGYGLASFNYLLAMTPEEQRARYSAMFQIAVAVSSAAGAWLGGLVSNTWGIPIVFLISGTGRLLAMGLFARFVRPPAAQQPIEEE